MKNEDNSLDSKHQITQWQRRSFIKHLSVLLSAAALPTSLITHANTAQTIEKSPNKLEQQKQQSSDFKKFLLLSTLLTGFDHLNKKHAELYLNSIRANSQQASILEELYQQGGFNSDDAPDSLEELQASGVFNNTDMRQVSDDITIAWYSGIYHTANGPQVATHEHALCWRAVSYTTPPTVCGGKLGFWSNAVVI